MPVVRRLHSAPLEFFLRSPSGPVARDLVKRGLRVRTRARRNLGGSTGSGPKRVDTGVLRSTIYAELVTERGDLRVRVGSRVRYAYWVHEGTGIYGPRKARIYPKRAAYLRWKNKATGKYVYARSTKGMKPNRFLVNALPAADLRSGSF